VKKVLLEFEVDTQKLPLGKLSKQQLTAAYAVLTKLQGLLGCTGPAGSDRGLLFVDLSNMLYTLLPSLNPAVIDTAEKVAEKIEAVDALREMEIATSMLKNPAKDGSVNELDAYYSRLKCGLELLPPASEERAMVERYLQQTHAPTHTQYQMELQHVWKVERAGEAERYARHAGDGNRQLLWHGSRVTNFAGIISQGLRIAPPEAPATGYMFGKGAPSTRTSLSPT
jgi:poly [ADP-ribose] polymerase